MAWSAKLPYTKPMKTFALLASTIALATLNACATSPTVERAPASVNWTQKNGIETALVDDKLVIIRANPARTPLELYNSRTSPSLNVEAVANRNGYSVVINAAMFAKDYVTSIGYMKNFDYVNNPKVSPRLRGFLLFHPKNKNSPAVKIGGEGDLNAYHTAFQSHRVWVPGSGPLWKKGKTVDYRIGLVGVDAGNRVLFFFHPDLVDVHDMVARILELKLDLKGLLYLDGGNHATLYQAAGYGNQSWNTWMALPNLLGLKAGD
jgi:hypothetical protein